MALNDTLKHLGFSGKEADLYLALLELGEASVLAIAKKSGIKRPTAYVLLQSLEEKGFIARVVKGKKSLFSAHHPQKLLSEGEFRLKELKEALPQMESLYKKERGKPRVMMYEGKERLDSAYDEMFLTKGEVLFISNISLVKEGFPRTLRKLEYKERSQDFWIRELITDDPVGRTYAREVTQKPYHEVRFLPSNFKPFQNDIGIYGNRVLISSLKKEYFVVAIESEDIAQTFRSMFELMWRAAI